ncbi:tyrosine decarboxylase MfnA [Streptomyces sp. Alain-F2R5]|jgi:tyrosine decarboxylase/tyrosine decarboxylase/aspartate 1-decarboxylase|uniref:tyrosine decarboxylase MfnA n=1 Tax=Streptomyces TaxID=1883 RepID=UPI000A220D7B|nr:MULTISPECIES: tyrosine decarboxylase MfnA [unclassified Streptomyces]MDQ0384405.1 tyrosine decarboxylase/tyrosine decarboxylase/aspartate 1-decarboxylase [Streptomyces sp. DSM 42143]OSC71388.1 tyrosine decarboxylase MnfA [Streptomyces sp. 4F]PAK27757.1 tyrosine decarboxylase MfnA [Streptomyces sp. alain-838]PAN02986.1 tyrosine decarboxylase MfnA [Streptomyces sp. Alain-F2R5]
MREAGAPASEVRRRIATELADDVPWNRVLNSICTEPHPLGVEMASATAHTNLGDVRIFRGTKRIERKVVESLLDLLGNPAGSGSLVSGGTEANLIAMLVARESARARGRLTDRPEVVVSSTVHFSFTKVFGLLGLTPVVVPVDDTLRLPAGEVARRIGEHTVAVVATAGSSEFGVVDAVDEIGPVVAGRGVHLHVDAATGGFIIPFARELGHDLPQFDFTVDGVDSITIDPHKYGLANVPAGAILFRGAQDAGRFAVDSFFIDTPVHHTFLGTRPGSAAVSTYAVLEHLGRDGFRDLTRTNYEVTKYLVDGLRAAGHELFTEPQLNIVVVEMPHAVRISQLLESRGWIVSTSKRFGETLRLVVTRHVTAEMVDEFLPELERACRDVAAEVALR